MPNNVMWGSAKMFSIGDAIFYPKYGAGYIVNIEEKDIYGAIKKYYVINLIGSDILTMLPVECEVIKKLRSVIEQDSVKIVYEILMGPTINLPQKWIERYKCYCASIEEGDIFKLSGILNSIYYLPRKKEISKSDIKIFDEILIMISSELSIVQGIEIYRVKELILEFLESGGSSYS